MGYPLEWESVEQNRKGDHICYISDLTKISRHFPDWRIENDLPKILQALVERQRASLEVSSRLH